MCYFPLRPTPPDLPPVINVSVEIFPFIFTRRLVCLNSCPLGFRFFLRLPFVFVIWNGLTGSSDPCWPTLPYLSEWHITEPERILICTPCPAPGLQTALDGGGTHWPVCQSSYNKARPVIICIWYKLQFHCRSSRLNKSCGNVAHFYSYCSDFSTKDSAAGWH